MRVDITSPEEMTEMPKSVTFQRSGLDHEGMTEALARLEKAGGGVQLSGLMSLWTTPLLCMYSMPVASWERIFHTWAWEGRFCGVEWNLVSMYLYKLGRPSSMSM